MDSADVKNIKVLKKIGQGTFGFIYLVKSNDGTTVVLKKIPLAKLSKTDVIKAKQEAIILSKLKHLNIVSYKGSFISDGSLHLMMAYCSGGDLHAAIKRQKGSGYFSETRVVRWFIQITMALLYLHQKSLIHRDLKPQNIFLTSSGLIKVGDFGVSRILFSVDMAKTYVGTPLFMSPEILSGESYNHKSDIWSLGCCLYQMMTLKHAFERRESVSLIRSIAKGIDVAKIPPSYSNQLKLLTCSLLEYNPDLRPNAAKILQVPFIKNQMATFLEDTKLIGNSHSHLTQNVYCDDIFFHSQDVKDSPNKSEFSSTAPNVIDASTCHSLGSISDDLNSVSAINEKESLDIAFLAYSHLQGDSSNATPVATGDCHFGFNDEETSASDNYSRICSSETSCKNYTEMVGSNLPIEDFLTDDEPLIASNVDSLSSRFAVLQKSAKTQQKIFQCADFNSVDLFDDISFDNPFSGSHNVEDSFAKEVAQLSITLNSVFYTDCSDVMDVDQRPWSEFHTKLNHLRKELNDSLGHNLGLQVEKELLSEGCWQERKSRLQQKIGKEIYASNALLIWSLKLCYEVIQYGEEAS